MPSFVPSTGIALVSDGRVSKNAFWGLPDLVCLGGRLPAAGRDSPGESSSWCKRRGN